ncbi:glycosyltransferase family 32 protein [Paracoccus panacisoli]|uniref:Glycosyltransferase family 32 protein n=1 Tax=Paracoccus panacisoli TaxID=1510163 RepID=A0ABV6T5H2_9RHOB
MTAPPPIPRRLSHIWIGPRPAPRRWMESWPAAHPDWSYTVFGNDTLTGHPFRLRALINEYAWRGAWAGVQDMMRYELLYRYGGFMADADAICLHPVDELLDGARAYTVHDRPESDPWRGVCPILACEPGNPFVGAVIDRLATLAPWELRKPEASTGNRFLWGMIRELAPGDDALRIWPVHYFVPWQKSAPDQWYDGPDRVYAEQKWGTSMWAYNREGGPSDEVLSADEIEARRAAILERLAGAGGETAPPRPERDSARREAAEAAAATAQKTLDGPEVTADFQALGEALAAAMATEGLPARFQGVHFYRHLQNHPLAESKLRTANRGLRAALLGWLASARRALVVGHDTGHLIAAALRMNPALRIASVDAGGWAQPKDPDPPRRAAYVGAAADWLTARFPDRVLAAAGDERAFLARPDTRAAAGDEGFDLVLFTDTDLSALGTLIAARPLMAEDAVVVAASPGGGAAGFNDRLRVQGLAHRPLARREDGGRLGSLVAFRLTDRPEPAWLHPAPAAG